MLIMKWMTAHDGRLVATWIQSAESGCAGCCEAAIMVKLKWTMDRDGRLARTPAQSGETMPAGMQGDREVLWSIFKRAIFCWFGF